MSLIIIIIVVIVIITLFTGKARGHVTPPIDGRLVGLLSTNVLCSSRLASLDLQLLHALLILIFRTTYYKASVSLINYFVATSILPAELALAPGFSIVSLD